MELVKEEEGEKTRHKNDKMTAVKDEIGNDPDFEIQCWWIAGCLTLQGTPDYIDSPPCVCGFCFKKKKGRKKPGAKRNAILCFIKKIYSISHYSHMIFLWHWGPVGKGWSCQVARWMFLPISDDNLGCCRSHQKTRGSQSGQVARYPSSRVRLCHSA